MEELFSTNSEAIIQKKLDIEPGSRSRIFNTDADLDLYFDTEQISKWINANKFKRVHLNTEYSILIYNLQRNNKLYIVS